MPETELIEADTKKILEYTSMILRDLSYGKVYTSTIKTCEYLLWCVKDMENLTKNIK